MWEWPQIIHCWSMLRLETLHWEYRTLECQKILFIQTIRILRWRGRPFWILSEWTLKGLHFYSVRMELSWNLYAAVTVSCDCWFPCSEPYISLFLLDVLAPFCQPPLVSLKELLLSYRSLIGNKRQDDKWNLHTVPACTEFVWYEGSCSLCT